VTLYFKFKSGVEAHLRARTIRVLREENATRVARLFPRTSQPELEQHYVVEAKRPADLKRLTKILKSANEVEFVHGEVRRGPK